MRTGHMKNLLVFPLSLWAHVQKIEAQLVWVVTLITPAHTPVIISDHPRVGDDARAKLRGPRIAVCVGVMRITTHTNHT